MQAASPDFFAGYVAASYYDERNVCRTARGLGHKKNGYFLCGISLAPI
jgi:hypothetical protein